MLDHLVPCTTRQSSIETPRVSSATTTGVQLPVRRARSARRRGRPATRERRSWCRSAARTAMVARRRAKSPPGFPARRPRSRGARPRGDKACVTKEPREQRHAEHDPGNKGRGLGEEHEPAGREQGRGEEDPLALAGDTAAAKERGHGRPQPSDAAQDRDPAEGGRSRRHLAFDDRAIGAGKGPEAFARDHDSVGSRHSAKRRQRCLIGPREECGGGGPRTLL